MRRIQERSEGEGKRRTQQRRRGEKRGEDRSGHWRGEERSRDGKEREREVGEYKSGADERESVAEE